MKDWIISFVMKYAGIDKIWAMLDGKKTYAAAGLGILTSLAGLGVEVAPLLAAHNTAGLITLVQGFPHDPSWLSLVASIGLLGIGHSQAKAADATAVAPLPPTP